MNLHSMYLYHLHRHFVLLPVELMGKEYMDCNYSYTIHSSPLLHFDGTDILSVYLI